MTRRVLRGGWLIDGSGAPGRQADVLIQDDRILAVGAIGECADAQKIDAHGKNVCPAFIDIHRHMDAKPLLGSTMENELRQGIASAVAGNCGFSLAPGGGAFGAEKRANDLPILGAYPPEWGFSFPEYMDRLEACRPGVNSAAMIGMGALRICLNGFSDAPLSNAQMEAGRSMLAEALEAGAAGVSAGIMYLPEYYTRREEYAALLRSLRGTGKPLVTHIRGEGDTLVASIAEVLEIARDTQCPLEISHFKSCGMHNWNREIHCAIDLIERARAGAGCDGGFFPLSGRLHCADHHAAARLCAGRHAPRAQASGHPAGNRGNAPRLCGHLSRLG